MKVRNISNQTIPLRRTDVHGTVLDTLQIAPGDNEVHELWAETIKTSRFADLMTTTGLDQPYEGPTVKRHVEAQPATGEPSSAVKHDDMPPGSAPHPGRPHPGETPEQAAKREADEAAEAKKRIDEKGPGTRRRDG